MDGGLMSRDDPIDAGLTRVIEEAAAEVKRFTDLAERQGGRFVGPTAAKSAAGEVADGGFLRRDAACRRLA
jgi:hypothetical protein